MLSHKPAFSQQINLSSRKPVCSSSTDSTYSDNQICVNRYPNNVQSKQYFNSFQTASIYCNHAKFPYLEKGQNMRYGAMRWKSSTGYRMLYSYSLEDCMLLYKGRIRVKARSHNGLVLMFLRAAAEFGMMGISPKQYFGEDEVALDWSTPSLSVFKPDMLRRINIFTHGLSRLGSDKSSVSETSILLIQASRTKQKTSHCYYDFYNCIESVPCKSKAASVPAGSRNSPSSVTAGGS
ncbi:hypothetical protein Tco_1345445 [Tanacetum coccineum]